VFSSDQRERVREKINPLSPIVSFVPTALLKVQGIT